MGGFSRTRRVLGRLVLACFAAVALGGAGTANAVQINGISDQNVGTWSGLTNDVFRAVDLPYVRMFVPWNVGLHAPSGGGCATDLCRKFVEVSNWISAAHAQGKQVMISFDRSGPLPQPFCAPGDPAPCPDGNYRYAVDMFRAHFPDVTEFTAWNEPNLNPSSGAPNPHDNPVRAARYWNQLNAACQIPSSTGKRCTVAAGDFSDYGSDAALADYTSRYKAALNPSPAVWAVHAYEAVDRDTTASLFAWINGHTDGKPVWITEVGAYHCTLTGPRGDAAQQQGAGRLNALMQSAPAAVDRAYYYFLAARDGRPSLCPDPWNGYQIDTGLISHDGQLRPALRTLFPAIQPPTATVEAASDVRTETVTLNGQVNPHGLPTRYRFEYGTTTAYGASAPVPDGNAGAGKSATRFSPTISDLEPDTEYHFRVVATNAVGTTVSDDAVFKTRTTRAAQMTSYVDSYKSDLAMFAPSTGVWNVKRLNVAGGWNDTWGQAGDVPVPGDYVGDSKAELALYRPTTNEWWIRRLGVAGGWHDRWGQSGDIPVPGDYVGDDKFELALYRPSTGQWFIRQLGVVGGWDDRWGQPGDLPVAGDYVGDDKFELALYRPSTGQWWIKRLGVDGGWNDTWGLPGQIPVPGDYVGDEKSDLVTYDPTTGRWGVKQLNVPGGWSDTWGLPGQVPVPGDYVGSTKFDLATYDPATGRWGVKRLNVDGGWSDVWGSPGEIPVASMLLPTEMAELVR